MQQLDLFGGLVDVKSGMTKGDIENMVKSVLSGVTLGTLVSYLTNAFEQMLEYYELSNGGNSCKKMSLLFNPHRLDTRALGSDYSIYGAICSKDGFLSSLARAMSVRYNSSGMKPRDLLYRAFQFGAIDGVKYVNEFPPKVARDLCLEYGVTKGSRVLDPCAGWGGRMIGVSTVCDTYVGFEPATRTYHGLLSLFDFLSGMNPSFVADVRCLPFEDSVLDGGTFDFALTSPPYYDTEFYSDEETNSLNRYTSFSDWCDNFYVPMIRKTMDALKDGHFFVLNIGSRVYPLNEVLFDNFSSVYRISRHSDMLMQRFGGLGGVGKEGETFYVLQKI